MTIIREVVMYERYCSKGKPNKSRCEIYDCWMEFAIIIGDAFVYLNLLYEISYLCKIRYIN